MGDKANIPVGMGEEYSIFYDRKCRGCKRKENIDSSCANMGKVYMYHAI
jgi:hypothetical protein